MPTILYIFSGRKGNLQLQSKIMHTRIYGQFAVVPMFLTLMGFKTYMDSMGKFISQKEADTRVNEMKDMRADLLRRIEFDKQMNERRKKMIQNDKQSQIQGDKKKLMKKKVAENVDLLAIEDA